MRLKDVATSLRALGNERVLTRKRFFDAMQAPPLPFDSLGFGYRASILISKIAKPAPAKRESPRKFDEMIARTEKAFGAEAAQPPTGESSKSW
jgi:hypothetical protein